MITVHHLENSRSQRVLWLLEELGAPYEIISYKRNAKTMRAPPALARIYPLGKSPAVTDAGLTIAETGAIVTYLVETYGQGRLGPPTSGADRWKHLHFTHHAEGSAMPPLVMTLVLSRAPSMSPAILRPLLKPAFAKIASVYLQPQLAALGDYWEASLAETGWFAGPEFSAADVMMSFPLETGAQRVGFADRPNCRDFLARIHARSAYAAALSRGGPYAYA